MVRKAWQNQYNNDWNHISREAGLNCWIGKFADGSVGTVQTMPWNYKPWGCGSGKNGSCNNGWIQFEICEDDLKNKEYFNAVYKEACEITAYLCKTYGIDPKGTVKVGNQNVPTILCHYDSYKYGLGSNHGDVYNWFNKYGKTMDDVRNDVAKLIEGDKPQPTPTPSTTIKAGDLVKIRSGAKYANVDKAVPSWVTNDKWYVDKVSGDKALIGKNEKKTNNIVSWVYVKDLTVVKATTTTTTAPTTSKPQTAQPTATYSSGQKITLNRASSFASSDAKNKSNVLTGTYYIWNDKQINKRIRITTMPKYVGKAGYVTGWVNVSDIK